MSGVATLKARGVKRPIDEMAIDVPASCSPARFALRPAASSFKRTRFSPPPSARANNSRYLVSAASASAPSPLPLPPPSHAAGSSAAAAPPPSNAKAERLSPADIASLARHVPKRLKKAVARYAAGATAPSEKLFTVQDLKEIVTSVCAEREAELTDEFKKLLDSKLAEQFLSFSRYNQDYLTRSMRDRDCSYLS